MGKVGVKNRRVFLSGPMSDDPQTYHAHDFLDAQVLMKRLGAKGVYNPASEWLSSRHREDMPHEWWMRRTLHELTETEGGWEYDLLVSLPGWERSAGARIEREVALACGIEVCELGEVG